MIKYFLIVLTVVILFFSGCAGMDPRYQADMATNAVGWGALGAIAGVGIAAVTGGNVGGGAFWGGLSGAALGAINTPSPYSGTTGTPYYYGGYHYGYYPPGQTTCYNRIPYEYRVCDRYECWFETRWRQIRVPCW